ncbi:hypothetical protein [Haloarcula japonica]|uniref:Uncharacterized protein n=1 Tax=Haloarcula japonica (strain ATCC 49778 / DSM 6131 / JCM 7785 / NBRC 101032 / NCIMB 13157 / TR-1) TaxID=1227453 RepID=M0LAY9_HALJT|nr:hypothetical protein [Haloarcula japonica]EMA29584.1 hypothetical protein C444_12332 [Haloarcula japonica DSM 6131]
MSEQTPSIGHLLLVWLLVGPSMWSLGTAVADAIQAELPLSTMGVGLLFGTTVVVLFWTAGFQPSLTASFGYFITEQAIDLILLFGTVFLFVPVSTPWATVALQFCSICLAVTLVFTPVGKQIQNVLRRHIRSVLKLPPQKQSANND